MKNLAIVFLLFSTSLFSQNTLGVDFFNFLKNENYFDKNVKYDSVFVQPFVDSIKNFIIENKEVVLPKFCNNNTPILDLNDLMSCISEIKIDEGYLFANSITPNKNSSDQELFTLLTDELIPVFTIENLRFHKININVFSVPNEIVTTTYNPFELSVTEERTFTNTYIIIVLMYN
jgi:hypothetical protein